MVIVVELTVRKFSVATAPSTVFHVNTSHTVCEPHEGKGYVSVVQGMVPRYIRMNE